MLLFDPEKKLSRQRTSRPAAKSRSHRCDPKKPAPPVIRIAWSIPPAPYHTANEMHRIKLKAPHTSSRVNGNSASPIIQLPKKEVSPCNIMKLLGKVARQSPHHDLHIFA